MTWYSTGRSCAGAQTQKAETARPASIMRGFHEHYTNMDNFEVESKRKQSKWLPPLNH